VHRLPRDFHVTLRNEKTIADWEMDEHLDHDWTMESFREAVLMALPGDEARERLPELPQRGEFHVRRLLDSAYFC
jgi:DNA-directed RNA polymerase